jgi:hypothetical protein
MKPGRNEAGALWLQFGSLLKLKESGQPTFNKYTRRQNKLWGSTYPYTFCVWRCFRVHIGLRLARARPGVWITLVHRTDCPSVILQEFLVLHERA